MAVDCDARAVFCKKDRTPVSLTLEDCCLYYKNTTMFSGAATHQGDNQVGGSGDDEIIVLDLKKMPTDVGQILLTLDLFKEKKDVGYGKIQEAFVRFLDTELGEELVRDDISNLHSGSDMIVAERLQRKEEGWLFIKDGVSVRITDIDDFIGDIPKSGH